jgi:hypothetical protein
VKHGSTRNAVIWEINLLLINMLLCISVSSCSRLATCF